MLYLVLRLAGGFDLGMPIFVILSCTQCGACRTEWPDRPRQPAASFFYHFEDAEGGEVDPAALGHPAVEEVEEAPVAVGVAFTEPASLPLYEGFFDVTDLAALSLVSYDHRLLSWRFAPLPRVEEVDAVAERQALEGFRGFGWAHDETLGVEASFGGFVRQEAAAQDFVQGVAAVGTAEVGTGARPRRAAARAASKAARRRRAATLLREYEAEALLAGVVGAEADLDSDVDLNAAGLGLGLDPRGALAELPEEPGDEVEALGFPSQTGQVVHDVVPAVVQAELASTAVAAAAALAVVTAAAVAVPAVPPPAGAPDAAARQRRVLFLLQADRTNCSALLGAGPALRGDRAFMLQAIQVNGRALAYAGPRGCAAGGAAGRLCPWVRPCPAVRPGVRAAGRRVEPARPQVCRRGAAEGPVLRAAGGHAWARWAP